MIMVLSEGCRRATIRCDSDIAASKGLDANTILDLDATGNVCTITFEHASLRTDVSHLIVEGIAA